jgi:hypothetical protein
VSATAPQHLFKVDTADAMKKAYIEQRVLKTWKKTKAKE